MKHGFRHRRSLHLAWLVPLLLSCGDAFAWGLYTHVYFAQLLLWAVPLADPSMRRLLRRFPRLVLAGACLPDLSLMAGSAGAPQLSSTHHWKQLHALLDGARSDAEQALACGYASHLLVDIIAHNHFVPAHEHLWFESQLMTHVAAEWAMDHHVRRQLFARPADLMRSEAPAVVPYVARVFGADQAHVARALTQLGQGEVLLRACRLPQLLHLAGRNLDLRLARRFDRYLSHTARRLPQIERVLAGECPRWLAEVEPREARARVAGASRRALKVCLPLPEDLFQLPLHTPTASEASSAPMVAPASTSLG